MEAKLSIIAIVILVAIFFGVYLYSNSYEAEEVLIEASTEITTNIVTSTDITTTNITTTETTTEVTTKSYYSLGDESTLGVWSVKVNSSKTSNRVYIDDYYYFHPDEGTQYLLISTTFKNNGKEAETLLPSYYVYKNDNIYAKIYYGDGYEFSPTILYTAKNEIHDKVLNPLSSVTGDIVFKLPNDIANSSEELILVLENFDSTVKYKIR